MLGPIRSFKVLILAADWLLAFPTLEDIHLLGVVRAEILRDRRNKPDIDVVVVFINSHHQLHITRN